MAKYYYVDSYGIRHCTTTETGRLPVESGEMYMETIHDSGDYTAQLRKTGPWAKKLSIGALGASRI